MTVTSGSHDLTGRSLGGKPGAGAFGAWTESRGPVDVYEATWVPDRRPALVKVLRAEVSADAGPRARAVDVLTALARLRPPGFEAVLEVHDDPRGPLRWVTERLEGEPLEALLARRGPFPEAALLAARARPPNRSAGRSTTPVDAGAGAAARDPGALARMRQWPR